MFLWRVRFATVALGMRKAESPAYGRSDRDFHKWVHVSRPHSGDSTLIPPFTAVLLVVSGEH